MKMKFLLLSILSFLSFCLNGQTFPAGIGSTDGSGGDPELYLWLLPDSLALTDGADVLSWTDFSGKSQDLTAASATSPVFKAGTLNGHNYLEFSKNNNRIVRNPFDMPTDAVAVFMVLRTNSSDDDGILSYNASGAENNYLFIEPGSFRTYINGNQNNSGQSVSDGSWNIVAHQWRNSDGRLLLYMNGTELQSNTQQSGVSLAANGCLAIGGEQDGVDAGYGEGQDYDGDLAEVIMYGSSIKQAQRVVIENYLAQKYGLDASLTTDCYVPLDASYIKGLTGMGKESDGTTILQSDGLVISQNGNFNNGEYVFAAHNQSVNAINSAPGALYPEVKAVWERNWYVDKTGSVDVKIAFDFSEGIGGNYPADISGYRLMYKATLAAEYDTISVSDRGVQNGDQIYFSVNDADFSDGYYSLGTVDETNSPLDGTSSRTWYSLISGDWDNWEVWTLDPSGALPNNPDNLTPSTSSTANSDNVVILTGKTVTVSSDNKTHNAITVDGRLDLQATSGHSFNEIDGRGRILLSSDNFPSGDASDFVSAGQGEGTVEYYGTGFSLNTAREFFDLEIDLDDSAEQLTLLKDYTVNGNLRIKQGTIQINDASATTGLNISVTGDVVVESNGNISTGTANARHQFNFYGDFTNNGSVAFTNRTSAGYSSEATNGIVDANFLNASKNQTLFCNGSSTFYRIEIDKGTDDTYELAVEATDPSYFNIYGYAAQSHGSVEQLTSNSNALGLIKGTVRIKSNVTIPVLNTGGNYNVSEAARLWVDGGTVMKNSGTAIVPYGKIRVSAGVLEARISSGITIRGNGLVKVEGGTLTINQLRTSVLGASNVGGYVQSGGVVNILGGSTNTDYYCFNLTYGGNVFNMTGGTLHIQEAHGKGAIFIASDEINYNVSGGTVIMEIDDGNDFPITSTAPFYNVILRNTSGGSGEHILAAGADVGQTDEDLDAQPLVVLNDLTIESDAFLNHDGNDVTIGRDFYIDAAAQTKTFNTSGLNDTYNDYNVGYLFDQAKPNATTFNGSKDAELYIGYNNSDGFEEYFHDFIVNKTEGSEVTVVCGTKKTAQYQDDNNRNHYYARLVRVQNNLSVESGILDQGQNSFRLYGPLSIGAKGECGVWEPGVTHPWAMLMLKDADLNIDTEKGAILGNIKMNPNPQTDIISFSSDVYIKRIAYFHGRINLQGYELKLDYLDDGLTTNNYDVSDGNSSQEMFYTTGNVSDGGLLLYIPADTSDGTVFPFPLGVQGKYTPAEITLSNVIDDGYVRIVPVSSELQTTNLSGGDVLQYYWRVEYEDFDNIPTVDQLRFYYVNADVVGTESNYVAGKVLDEYPFNRDYEDSSIPESEGVNSSANTITFNGQTDSGFTLEKASYTAGVTTRFQGTPDVFYLRKNGDWDDGDTWSFSRDGAAAGDYPQAGDIAILRRPSGYSGTVTVKNAEQAAAVIFDDETGFSSGYPRLIFSSENNYAAYNSLLEVVDVADTHEGGTLNYSTHGAVIQYNVDDNYSNANSSLEFDGNNDYVAVQNYSYSGGGHQELTVEAWIRTTDGSDQVIASFDRNQFWRLEVNGNGAGTGQIGFDLMTNSGQIDFGGSTRIDDGEWHHVAGVFDNGTVTIYVDGLLDNSTSMGSTFGTGTRYGFIGVGSEADSFNGSIGPSNYFDGNIAEMRIWSTARSQSEIQNSMNSALAGTETGLEVYYKLDGTDTDNTASDYTSNGNTGSLYNFTLPGAWTTVHPWSGSFPGGDFGGFNEYPNALVIYNWENASANADITLSSAAVEYPQMWFGNGNNSRIMRFPDADITVHGRFIVPRDVIVVANGETDNTITMEQNMELGHSSLGEGQFLFPGNALGSVTLDVKKNISLKGGANSKLGIEDASASNIVHKIIAEGDISVASSGGTVRLGDGDIAKTNVELELTGEGDHSFENDYTSDTPVLYRVIVNKGADTTSTFSFDSNFQLTGATDGVDVDKALDLQNGKLILNHADIDIALSTGDDEFVISGTAGLEIKQGQATVSGNSGIILDGLLKVSGGTLDMSGGDNYIQYSATGDAVMNVSGGTVTVGSQIRRGLSSSEGILKYSQSGGLVTVGSFSAPEDTRGMFEVLNPESEFNFSGGELIITRSQSNPEIASLYLSPESAVSSTSGIIRFGNTNTPAGQVMGIYSTVDLPNIIVDNSSNNDPEVKMWTVSLTVSNNTTIDADATLDANGLDLILYGDFTVNGDFLANDNTTYFSGDSGQDIYGKPVFYNLTKNGTGTLSIDENVTVENVLRHQSGTLADQGNSFTVKGDIYFDGAHTWTSGGDGVLMAGTEQQNLQGSGTFGKLTIDNTEGIFIPEGNTIRISDALQMENGIFDIGKNLLELSENAEIIEANAFSEQNMIQTNISFTDAGIKKWFPAVSSTTTFIYPIGSAGKYTPVEFNIDQVDAGGYIRVKAADEKHPTVVNDDEPCNDITDEDNVLDYYWVLEASSISNLTGTASMKYYPEDIQVDNSLSGTSYDITDYATARLLENSTDWNKYDANSFDENNELLMFYFSGTDDNGVSGDYTAGIEDQGGTCEGAIPDKVPTYITTADGIWSNDAIWDTYPVSGGTVPAGGPRGAAVIIAHNVSLTNNYKVSYKTEITAAGKLSIGSTYGHRLGEVTGQGTLSLQRGELPAGVYDDFLSASGGTLEFGGTDDYDILSENNFVNNLRFTGSGERRLPNLNLEVYGNIELDGPSLINEHDHTLTLNKDFVFDSGSFDAGDGTNAKVVFSGSAYQTVSGSSSFTGSNAFNNMEVNNNLGVVVGTDIEIEGVLTLSDGVVNNSSGNRFAVLSYVAGAVQGGGATSYVQGPFEKVINTGASFGFPVGDGGRFGEIEVSDTQTASAAIWEVSYFNNNPDDDGFDPDSYVSPVEFVSKNEYWRVKAPGSVSAYVTIRWDSQSGVSADASERADLRLVSWKDLTTDAWDEEGQDITDNGQNSGTIKSDALQNFNEFGAGNYFTLGGIQTYTYSWLGNTADWFTTSNWAGGTVPSLSTEVDIPETPSGGNHPVIDGDAYCKDLLIYNNATVTLDPGATLNINNSFVNNGEVILKSTPDAVSALNVPAGNSDSGNGRIELPVKANQWYRLGQPVASPAGAIYDAADATSWVYRSTSGWERITDNGNAIDPMEGIMVLYESDHTIDYTGTLNTGNMSWTIPYGPGYYLFSNPYPSSVKWDIDDVEDTGVNISENLSATIYYRVYAGSQVGDYLLTYNGYTELSTIEDGGSFPGGYTAQNMGNISPLQSVWVKVNDTPAGDATIELSNKARVADNSMPLKSAAVSRQERDILRLMQTNEFISDVAVVYFDDNFSSGLERSDSEKMFNQSKQVPEVYTRAEGKSLSINGLPALTGEPVSIPVSVRNQAESPVKMSLNLDDFKDDYNVYIEDNETGTLTDMRATGEYVYTPIHKKGHDQNRFVLHLNPVKQVPTSLESPDESEEGIKIIGQKEYALVIISSGLLRGEPATIEVMDIKGRLISEVQTNDTETEVPLPDNRGVYIVKVTVEGQQKTGKVAGL